MKRRSASNAPARKRWPALAEAVATQLTAERLHPSALAAIGSRAAHEPVAIACSGGADSMALLLVLWALMPERRGRWVVLHFNHKLRGRDADADVAFVRSVARGLGERFVSAAWQRVRAAVVSEAAARTARWDFFQRAMRDVGTRVIALGHQADDVAETMLMRLTRGSGAPGLAAPRPVQRMADGTLRVRPLLAIPAGELRTVLRAAGVRWREDRTNGREDFFRNRVRLRVLPALQQAAPQDALAGFGAARSLLEEDDAALEVWLDQLLPAPIAGEGQDVSSLKGLPRALARRALLRWLNAQRSVEMPARAGVECLVAAIAAGRRERIAVGTDQWIEFADGVLALRERPDAIAHAAWPTGRLACDRILTGPSGDRLAARLVRLDPVLRRQIRAGRFPHTETVFLDPGGRWPGWFGVRAWKPGDRYRPLGAPGRRKLQDVFVDRRVPRELRGMLPVVTDSDNRPLWVPGIPPAAELAVQPRSKLVVQLTYTCAAPTVHRSKKGKLHDV